MGNLRRGGFLAHRSPRSEDETEIPYQRVVVGADRQRHADVSQLSAGTQREGHVHGFPPFDLALAQAPVTRVTLDRLNITITALYALAELGDDEAAIRDAIINSGLGGKRLTAASVRDAIETMRAERREAEAERQASADATPDAGGADDGGDGGHAGDGGDDGGGGGEGDGEGGNDDDATDDDTAVPPADGFGKPNLLAHLLTQLKSFAFDEAAWPSAIKVVGAESVGELARAFEMALSRYRASESKSAVKAAADRAEALAEQLNDEARHERHGAMKTKRTIPTPRKDGMRSYTWPPNMPTCR